MEMTDFEQRYKELVTIINNPRWSPTEKVIYAGLRIKAHSHEHQAMPDGRIPIFDLTEDQLAAVTNVSRSTISDFWTEGRKSGKPGKAIKAGLLERTVDQKTLGWVPSPDDPTKQIPVVETHSVTYIKPIPDTLPPLQEAPRTERARASSKAQRDKLQELSEKLRNLECPDCHNVSDWHAVCGVCGHIWTADELAGTDTPGVETFHTDELEYAASEPSVETFHTSSSVVSEIPTPETDTKAGTTTQPLSDTPNLSADDVMTGAETVEYFADLGAALTSVYKPGAPMANGELSDGKQPITPVDEFGYSLGKWSEHPIPPADVLGNVARGGNAGTLPGYENWYQTDTDDGTLDEFLHLFPAMRKCARLFRDNAPGCGKLVFQLEGPHFPKKVYQGNGRKIEFLGFGAHAVIAGFHKTGAVIKCLPFPDEIPLFTFAEVDARCRLFTGMVESGTHTPVPQRGIATPSADIDSKAIYVWYRSLSDVNARIDAWIRTLPRKGRYIAIRPDDRNPSTLEVKDSYSATNGRTWHDFGTNRTYDVFDMVCFMTGQSKSELFRRAAEEYRLAHQEMKS